MTIVTINRAPGWGNLAVGAIVNLPPALAEPLIASGEAVPTPDGAPLQDWASGTVFGVIADGVALYDATTTNSTTCTVGSASASFTENDIGKVCVVIPYTDNGTTARYGTITAVASATSCTASLSGAPGALTGATFIYGSDNATALDAAFTAAAASATKAVVELPFGIVCTTGQHTVPTGCTLRGQANNPTGGKAKDFDHYGSSLVLCSYKASGAFVELGTTTTSDPRGIHLSDLNVDCANLAGICVRGNTLRTEHLLRVTVVRGTSTSSYKSAPTSRAELCVFLGANNGNTVDLAGDATFVNNIVTGAGNGYYGVKTDGENVAIQNNHIWKDASASTMLGGSVWVSRHSGDLVKGGVIVQGNKFDTQYGPAIKVSVSGSSTARAISIVGNHAQNNDAVANNTGPFLLLDVGAGSILRGLVVQGNIGRGSWNDPSKGQWSAFIDGAAVAGTIYGSVVGGNFMDNCNAMYTSFTPDHDNANITMAGTGTTQTKSTTT